MQQFECLKINRNSAISDPLIYAYMKRTLHSRITNASWLLKSFGNHIFYANHDIEYPNEDFFADQVNLVCEDT